MSLYERLHPSANPADIDALLAKHGALAKRLKRLLDLLKPQDKVRVRYQEDGSELDLDVAIRSLIDLRAGSQPDAAHQHEPHHRRPQHCRDLAAGSCPNR